MGVDAGRPSRWSALAPAARAARRALLLALGLSAASCDDGPIEPQAPSAVVWTRLTDPASIRDPFFPEWRGDSIAFQYLDPASRFHLGHMDEAGTGAVLYTDPGPSSDRFPRWLTEGILVYASNRAGVAANNYDIWYRDLATGEIRRLTSFAEREWSPAPRPGRPALAMAQGDEPLMGRITLIPDTASATLTRIYLTPDTLLAGEPDWHPNGDRICFSAEGPGGTRQIWLASLAADSVTSLSRLTSGGTHDLSPRFSPDGTKILFTSDRRGRSGIWWVSDQGEGVALDLIAFEDAGARIATPSWSPDGKRVILSTDGRGARSLWVVSNLGL